jgi:adenosylmethionine-8-amino-7-oxononanoate aminotransferase
MIKFQCGGSEVTKAAIKLGRQYHRLTGHPGKYKVVTRYLAWHGSTLGALSASGLKSRKAVNEPLAPGFLHVFPPTCYRCPFGKDYPSCGATRATKERFPTEQAFGVRVGKRALANGLLCRFDPHWLAFGPALGVTAEQVEEMVGLLDRSLGEVLNDAVG